MTTVLSPTSTGPKFCATTRDAELSWTSRANSRTSPTDREMAGNFQEFDLSEYRNLLVQGNNVLSIRGINRTSTDSDLLVLPELVCAKLLTV